MIGDLAKRTGTKVNTIRFYEEIGLMPEAARTSADAGLTGKARFGSSVSFDMRAGWVFQSMKYDR